MTRLIPMKGEEFVKKLLEGERDFSRIRLEEGFNLSEHKDFPILNEYLKEEGLYWDPIIMNESQLMKIRARGLYLPFVRAERAHFEGADFSKAFFGGADLCRSNFSKTNLNKAYLGANLEEAILEGAYLKKTYFGGADLGKANLRKTKIEKAYFGAAYLGGANLEEANLEGANFKRAYLGGASLKKTNLKGANLKGANLERACLEEANLEGANLRGAILCETTFKDVKNLEKAINLDKVFFYKIRVTEKEKRIIEEALKNRDLFIIE